MLTNGDKNYQLDKALKKDISYTLMNSTNNKNKRFFLKKIYLYIILFNIFFVSNLTAQTIDPNGFNVFYYANGTKSSEGYFKNGQPDSLWKTYSVNGNLIAEGFKKNGLSDSIWIFYRENETKKQMSFYENDLKNGCTVMYDSLERVSQELFYINDTLQNNILSYYPNGQIKSIESVKNGVKDGDSYVYNTEGDIVEEAYFEKGQLTKKQLINQYDEAGLKTGFWRTFYPNGTLKTEANYEAGKLNGLYKQYNKYGSLEVINYMQLDSISSNSRDIVMIELYREYYPGGVVEKVVGGLTNGKKNGQYREYDENGKLINGFLYSNDTIIAEGMILNDGTFDGEWSYFYPSGKVLSKGAYENGKKNGVWTYYFENGKIQQKGKYKDGIYDGQWIWYYETGAVRAQEFYRKGKLEGTIVEYDEAGNELTKGEYYVGLREGDWFYHVENSKEVGSYTLGLKNGIWKAYYQNGVLAFEGEFDEGQPKGKHKYYHENGVLKSKGKYSAGAKHGLWKNYSTKGETIELLEYYYGQLVKLNGERVSDDF
ncbi:MAG: hypothetical protein R3279_00750 [Putridiphycobacter sp.]|nr:hypothetical protein [Putridiphycobacter sp.]